MRTRRWHSPLYSSTSAAAATRSACAGRAIRASAVRLRRTRAASPASSPCTPRPINTSASPNSSCNTRMTAGRWRHGSPRPPFWMTSPSPLDIADWSEVGACWSGGGAAGLAGVVSIAEICALRSAICSALFNVAVLNPLLSVSWLGWGAAWGVVACITLMASITTTRFIHVLHSLDPEDEPFYMRARQEDDEQEHKPDSPLLR